jgi:predicted homoserine dehydrogenase-like protein
MTIYRFLLEREKNGNPLRVALVGVGSMGMGITLQIRETPGLCLVAVADIDITKAESAAALYQEKPFPWHSRKHFQTHALWIGTDIIPYLQRAENEVDVLIEATNTISYAARACIATLEKKIHVVLMNAEVDVLLGPLLHHIASENGALITSDAGDQHGVLMRMIEEISMWGFRIVMAGNIKGFLNRYATASSLIEEARIRNLNPIQCAAYTDGTKLNIEMALVAAATGMRPFCRGMEGPEAEDVSEVFNKFDFARYDESGVVDYILGAQPGGGVYVVGYCDDPVQMGYLKYYKMGNGPYYLFYRPYHLCHLETPWAIARLCLMKQPVLEPVFGQPTPVITLAKKPLKRGEVIEYGIGSDHFYGLIERREMAESVHAIPIALIDPDPGEPFRMKRDIPKDGVVTFDDLEMPDNRLLELYHQQQQLFKNGELSGNGVSVYPDGG